MAGTADSDGYASGTPQSWGDITNYIDASVAESAAMVRSLMLRLRMPPRALSTEWPSPTAPPESWRPPLPQQQHPNADACAQPQKKTTKKKNPKNKSTHERRTTQPCANCRRRHRRCNSAAGMGACAECARMRIPCTFAP